MEERVDKDFNDFDIDLSNLSISDYESQYEYESENDQLEEILKESMAPELIFDPLVKKIHSKNLTINSNFNLVLSSWAPSLNHEFGYTNKLQIMKVHAEQVVNPPIQSRNNSMVLSPHTVHVPIGSKFFVIKSFNEEDIKTSFHHKVWSSTELGNKRLNKAFDSKKPHERIFMFFSVNGSGKFCGIAEMISEFVYSDDKGSINNEIWTDKTRWNGKFNIQWIFVKDISNTKLRHMLVPQNEWRPLTNSRDTQELPFEIGYEVIEIFKKTHSKTSFLQSIS